jgi:hypothetical protein
MVEALIDDELRGKAERNLRMPVRRVQLIWLDLSCASFALSPRPPFIRRKRQ